MAHDEPAEPHSEPSSPSSSSSSDKSDKSDKQKSEQPAEPKTEQPAEPQPEKPAEPQEMPAENIAPQPVPVPQPVARQGVFDYKKILSGTEIKLFSDLFNKLFPEGKATTVQMRQFLAQGLPFARAQTKDFIASLVERGLDSDNDSAGSYSFLFIFLCFVFKFCWNFFVFRTPVSLEEFLCFMCFGSTPKDDPAIIEPFTTMVFNVWNAFFFVNLQILFLTTKKFPDLEFKF